MEEAYPARRADDLKGRGPERDYCRRRVNEILGDIIRLRRDDRHYTDEEVSTGTVRRFLGAPIDFHNPHASLLPRVPVINGFLARRQFYRQLSPAALSKLFSKSLVSVQWFRLERWTRPTPEEEALFVNGMPSGKHIYIHPAANDLAMLTFDRPAALQNDLLPSLPSTLREVFYDASILPGAKQLIYDPRELYQHQQQYPSLSGRLLHEYGHRFNTLVVSQPYDTIPFELDLCLADSKPWQHLETLCFRSTLLRFMDQRRTDDLLIKAAQLAAHMPNLRVLELWDAEKHRGFACVTVFRFSVGCQHQCTLEAHGTRHPSRILSRPVVRAWQKVAARRTHRDISTHTTVLGPQGRRVYLPSFIRRDLWSKVLHPFSARLMVMEGCFVFCLGYY